MSDHYKEPACVDSCLWFWTLFSCGKQCKEFCNNLWGLGGGQKLTGPEQPCFNSQWVHNSEALIQVFVSAWHRSLLQAACSLVMYRWHHVASARVSPTVWKLFLLLPLLSLPISGPAFPLAFCVMMPGKIDVNLLKERSVEELCHMSPCENPWVLHAGQLSRTTSCSLTLQRLQRCLTQHFPGFPCHGVCHLC